MRWSLGQEFPLPFLCACRHRGSFFFLSQGLLDRSSFQKSLECLIFSKLWYILKSLSTHQDSMSSLIHLLLSKVEYQSYGFMSILASQVWQALNPTSILPVSTSFPNHRDSWDTWAFLFGSHDYLARTVNARYESVEHRSTHASSQATQQSQINSCHSSRSSDFSLPRSEFLWLLQVIPTRNLLW